MHNRREFATKDIVLTALAAALLSAGKQALASIPNVEVVTLFIMLYAACFKPQIAFTVTGIFIVIECFIWGFNTWVFAYLIHWNLVALFTFILARVIKVKNRFIYFAFTIVITTAFGVLTSAIDAFVGWAKTGLSFGTLFIAVYVRGIYFYIVHVVGNAAFNITLFAPMRDLLDKLMIKYYGRNIFLKENDHRQILPSSESTSDAPSLTEAGARDTIDDNGCDADASAPPENK